MNNAMQEFETYRQLKKIIADLDGALNLLNWDQEVIAIKGGAERRASQIGSLAAIKQEKLVTEVYPFAQKLADSPNLNSFEQENIRQDIKDLEKTIRLPIDFVARLAEACSMAQNIWEQAKKEANFNLFQPALERLLKLKREEADFYGYAAEPYDALLDIYEPGATAQHIAQLFNNLIPPLKELLKQTQEAAQVTDILANGFFEKQIQWDLSIAILKKLGFNFEKGRQDISSHPFSISISMEDVRITTRIDERNLNLMLYSTIHECGHALYEQGLAPAYYGLPAAQACSLSIHESQSRLWENNIARSLSFCEFIFPLLTERFPEHFKGKGYTAFELYQSVNQVAPSLIRILADELTYHSHIALRFELERDLVNGKLQTKELPEAWNHLMKSYLGLEAPDDASGVLQDIHWSMGSLGYFPTYSLGSLYAAQFHHTLLHQFPEFETDIKNGKFENLHRWLQENIYAKGRLHTSEAICLAATGKNLDVQYFIQYMQNKLHQIYSFS
jgi:carboxypeptidase Taq